MSADQNQKTGDLNVLESMFVETAFTNADVEKAVAEEEQLGIRDGECAFLGAGASNDRGAGR